MRRALNSEAGVRPIRRPRDQAMFDRIEVDVVDVVVQIRLVTDLVLPEPALPDAAFTARLPGLRTTLQ
jgi:hypothetical protein